MKLELVKLEEKYRNQFMNMMDEWSRNIGEYTSPSALWKTDYHQFDEFIQNIESSISNEDKSANSFFFCLDEETDEFVGAIDIRHRLVKGNCHDGGHIATGIRPSKRRMGYGSAMMKLALNKCQEMGIDYVLITCDKKNIASARTIEKCGGVKENVPFYDTESEQRYWVVINRLSIETERLIIEREMPADYLDAYRWAGDSRVTKYLFSDGVKKPEEMLNWLETNDPNSKERMVMIARTKSDMKAIGTIGAFYNKEKDLWEFGYNVAFDDWGKGYATEMARGIMGYLNKNCGAHIFRAECALDNIASNRVLQKLGMKLTGISEYTKNNGKVTFSSNIYEIVLNR